MGKLEEDPIEGLDLPALECVTDDAGDWLSLRRWRRLFSFDRILITFGTEAITGWVAIKSTSQNDKETDSETSDLNLLYPLQDLAQQLGLFTSS